MMITVLKQPWLTEKSLDLAGKGWFSFVVHAKSTKPQIAEAVEKQFNVHVTGVRTTHIKSKTKRVGKQRKVVSAHSFKKAFVRLKSGEKISLFAIEHGPQSK